MFNDKKGQAEKSIDMQPVKPKMDLQIKKPVKQLIGLAKGKNCKATIHENIDSKSQTSRNSDKNWQENENNVMLSVTKKTDVQLHKPERLHSDKNCQSTRCYKCPMRPMNKYGRNC